MSKVIKLPKDAGYVNVDKIVSVLNFEDDSPRIEVELETKTIVTINFSTYTEAKLASNAIFRYWEGM